MRSRTTCAAAAAIHSVLAFPAIGPQNAGNGNGPSRRSSSSATFIGVPAMPNALFPSTA